MKKIIIISILLLYFFIPNSVFSQEETLIIFDSSVSMLEKVNGKPKYVLATENAINMLNNFPQSQPIGLRIIGVSVNDSISALLKNPMELCKSTYLLTPIRPNNIQAVKSGLTSIFPLGTTPLTYALQLAINNDFSPSAFKHIILISDGADSCNGNPCTYIKEISKSRKDIKIDIIAMDVTLDEFNQLKCLADSTNGSIINSKSPIEISKALVKYATPKINNAQNNSPISSINNNISPIDTNFNVNINVPENRILAPVRYKTYSLPFDF